MGSVAVAAAAVTFVVAGCSSSASSTASSGGASSASGAASSASASSGALSSYETGLSGVCPSNVNVQVNWWPSSDDAFLFNIIGANGTTDTSKNTYSGPIGNSGVTLTIQSGGPAASYQTDTALAYENDPYLYMESTDEQISNSAQHPSTAVFAWYQQYPLIFLWGNQSWNFTTMQQIAASGTKVLAFSSGTYVGLFEKEGLLTKAQVDTSYSGTPAQFVAAGGNIIQQGFVDEEPYQLQYETTAWGKPVKFLLVGNKDFPVYQDELAVRPDKLAAETPCLKKLVPLFQAASVDYASHPATAEAAIVKFTNSLKGTGVAVSAGLASYAYQAQLKYGLVANGTDGTYGSFSSAEIQSAITKLTPVFEGEGIHPKAGLQPSDLYTNQFLDSSIKLPG